MRWQFLGVSLAALFLFATATATQHGKSCGEGILDASLEILSNAVHEAYSQSTTRQRFAAAATQLDTLIAQCENTRASWLAIQIMKYTAGISVQHEEIGKLGTTKRVE